MKVRVENPAKRRILVDVSWHFVSTRSFSDHQQLAKMVPELIRTYAEINIRYLTDETRFLRKIPPSLKAFITRLRNGALR